MSEQEPISPRRRMQMLLAIPDSERSDEEWDELNELEISLAPGNRLDGPDPNLRKPVPGRARPQQPRQGPPRQPRPPRPQKQSKPAAASESPAADGASGGADQPAGGAPKKPFRRSPRRAARGNTPKGTPPTS